MPPKSEKRSRSTEPSNEPSTEGFPVKKRGMSPPVVERYQRMISRQERPRKEKTREPRPDRIFKELGPLSSREPPATAKEEHVDPNAKVETEEPITDEERIKQLLTELELEKALNEGLAENLAEEKAKAEKIELTGAKNNLKLHEEMEQLKTEMHKLQADHAKLQKDN